MATIIIVNLFILIVLILNLILVLIIIATSIFYYCDFLLLLLFKVEVQWPGSNAEVTGLLGAYGFGVCRGFGL